jgi:ATP-binding cassette, subfamily C, bacterial
VPEHSFPRTTLLGGVRPGLRSSVAGRTGLVVAHRLTQAVAADSVVVLDGGKVVERGTHDELVAAGGSYAQLWSAWSGTRT